MAYSKYNQLLKNTEFGYKFQTIIDNILSDFNLHNTNIKYKRGPNLDSKEKLEGVLYFFRGKWVWSWMNTINTNYSCLEVLVKFCNKFAKRDGKDTNEYFKFNGTDEENLEELDRFGTALKYYQMDLFYPNNDKKSAFVQMKFQTQRTWYRGLISQLYNLENINCFFPGECKFKLDYRRGNEEDMKNGIDVKIYIDGVLYTLQHKKDSLSNSDEKYDWFNSVIYKEKLYRGLDLFSVGDNTNNKIYIYKNGKTWDDCGMQGTFPKKNFRIKKSLKIEQIVGTELKNDVSKNLDELLTYCCSKYITLDIDTDEDVIGNKLEYSEDDEPSLYIIYNDIHDGEVFCEAIKIMLDKLKEKFDNNK